jgi:hypothetical protein
MDLSDTSARLCAPMSTISAARGPLQVNARSTSNPLGVNRKAGAAARRPSVLRGSSVFSSLTIELRDADFGNVMTAHDF